jgi:hypothetical protein
MDMDKGFKEEILKRYSLAVRRKTALEKELENLTIEINHLEPLARLYGSEEYFDTIEEERRITDGILKPETPKLGNRTGYTKYRDMYESIWCGETKDIFYNEYEIIQKIRMFNPSVTAHAVTSALYRGVERGIFEKRIDGVVRKYKYLGVGSNAGNNIHQE